MNNINSLTTIESIYINILKPSKYVTYYIKDREGNYINKTRDNKIITEKTHSNGVYFVNIDYYYDILDDLPLDIYNIINKDKYIYIICECNWWLRFNKNSSNEIIINGEINISNLLISNNILILDKFIKLKMDINLFILKMLEYKNDTIFNTLKYIIHSYEFDSYELDVSNLDLIKILNELNIDKYNKIYKIDILSLERLFNLIKLNNLSKDNLI
jgi:hypothetical protein